MKYVDTETSFFDPDAFSEPPAFFRPGYMWMWNGTLKREALEQRLREFKGVGSETVWPLPISKDFSYEVPTELDREFLSDGFFEVYYDFLDDARRMGLVTWLTDEPAWPSGSLCGQIVKHDPSLKFKFLVRETATVSEGFVAPEGTLAFFLDGKRIGAEELKPGMTAELYRAAVLEGDAGAAVYPDLLSEKTVSDYISLCFERYYHKIGERFGREVVALFDDEARCMLLPPWTPGIEKLFWQRFGYSLTDRLPDLFGTDADGARTRVDFQDLWSRLLAENYFGRLGDWCRSHGIFFMGHLCGDHQSDAAAVHGMGSPLRCLRKFDIPGVDVIWRQLWPEKGRHINAFVFGQSRKYPDNMPDENGNFPKFASSVAHQGRLPYALSESFAIYGNGLTPETMKKLTDYQLVRGINLITMSCSYLDEETAAAVAGCRPNFFSKNPVFLHMKQYNDYTARLCYLLSRGKPGVSVCLYFPVRDLWAKDGRTDEIIARIDGIAEKLLRSRIDFDYVDDDALESAVIRNGKLCIGEMQYSSAVVIPCRFMSDAASETLNVFKAAGGSVYDGEAELPLSGAVLHTDIKDIRAVKRIVDGGEIFFVTNEGTAQTVTLRFDSDLPCLLADAENGVLRKIPAEVKDGKTVLSLEISEWGSAAFVFGDYPSLAAKEFAGRVLFTFSDCTLCEKERYTVTEKGIMKEKTDKKPINAAFGDWGKYLGCDFSGTAVYSFSLDADAETAADALYLDLRKAAFCAEVTLNGKPLGKRIFAPYLFDVGGKLVTGNNVFEVTVTGTLANQYAHSHALDSFTEKEIGPYQAIEREFEKQETAGGLLCPPCLLGR